MKRNLFLVLILSIGLFLLTIGAQCGGGGGQSAAPDSTLFNNPQTQMDGYREGERGLVSITEMNQGSQEHLIAAFKSLAKRFNNWSGGYYTFDPSEQVNGRVIYFFPGHTCAGWFYVDDEENFCGRTFMATYSLKWVEKNIKKMQNDGKVSGGKLSPRFIATVIAYMQKELDAGW